MKKINFDVDIADEDFKAWKKGDLSLRVYHNGGHTKVVTVPKEEQDRLDREIIEKVILNFLTEMDGNENN